MYRIFGVEREGFSGDLTQVVAQVIHPEDRAAVEAANRRVIEEGVSEPLEYRVVRGDGSIRHVWAEAGELVRDGAGQPLTLTGIVQDVTERREAEIQLQGSLAEKETLLKEIHHRVKNNLQMISGMLRLQAMSSGDPRLQGVLSDSESRIRSMALIHEQLYGSQDLARIDMNHYIRSLVDSIIGSLSSQPKQTVFFKIEVADFALAMDRVIPLALIVNELLVNVFKHAFPAGFRGARRVDLRVAAAGAGRYELVVADNGVGLPAAIDPEKAATLGLQLVSLLVRQIGGTLALRRGPGCEFRVAFAVD
jgi:PAS domain S-box-containing protein